MFFGLNKFLKIVLPKRLFYRALIIVAAPTIILQLIITIVFYDSIWIKANKNITRTLVTQLKAIQEVYQNDKKNLDFFTDSYKNNFNLHKLWWALPLLIFFLESFSTNSYFISTNIKAGGGGSSFHHWQPFTGVIEMMQQGGLLLWDTPSQYGFLSLIFTYLIPFENQMYVPHQFRQNVHFDYIDFHQ